MAAERPAFLAPGDRSEAEGARGERCPRARSPIGTIVITLVPPGLADNGATLSQGLGAIAACALG